LRRSDDAVAKYVVADTKTKYRTYSSIFKSYRKKLRICVMQNWFFQAILTLKIVETLSIKQLETADFELK